MIAMQCMFLYMVTTCVYDPPLCCYRSVNEGVPAGSASIQFPRMRENVVDMSVDLEPRSLNLTGGGISRTLVVNKSHAM